MPRFRKKPVEIEAVQWEGTAEGATAIIDWILGSGSTATYRCSDPDRCAEHDGDTPHSISIQTLEGAMRADLGDWIIKGIAGEFYPCRDDIFRATYEAAGDGPRLLDRGLCYEEQGEEVHPHPECSVGKSDLPLVGFARIGLRVEPGFVDGVTAASWSKEAILSDADIAFMPNVEINGARSLALKDSRRVFAGDEQAQIFVDDRRYATSSAHPVVVEPFGPGAEGGFVTLTLIADKVTADGREVNDGR